MRSAEIWSSFHSDFVCLFEIVLRSAEVWSRVHLDLVCLLESVLRSAEIWLSFHSDFVYRFEIVLRSAEVWSRLYLDLVCLFKIVLRSSEIRSSFYSDFVCLFEIVLRSAEGANVVGWRNTKHAGSALLSSCHIANKTTNMRTKVLALCYIWNIWYMIYNSHEKVTLLWNESLENKSGQLCTIITTEISIQICENCFFHTCF